MEQQTAKPLGQKGYGTIPHLPGSRRGPGDKGVNEGQFRICCVKTPPDRKGDEVLVQVKLDGSNVGVARINGEIVALNRAGYRASSSSYVHHQLFHEWVSWPENQRRFAALLQEGERIMGEWLVLAHGTRYCVQEDTPVLFGDLTWRPAGSVTPGAELLAFDEFVLPGHQCRYWRRSFVVDVASVARPSYRIGLADGTEFIASADHLWLTKASSMVNWTRTDRLRGRLNNTALRTPQRSPSRLCRLLDVWEPGRSWSAGYLAGVFDGEGSLYQGPRKGRDRGSHLHLVFSQKENVVARQATDTFGALNVSYYANRRSSGAGGDVISYAVNGGVPETLRLLGHIRPQRLLDRLNLDLLGRMRVKVEVPVEHVEFLGDRELVAFTTTTRTFIANGFGSHNCLPHEPFVPFDLIHDGWERTLTMEFYERIAQIDPPFHGAHLLYRGQPLPLEGALALLDTPADSTGQRHHGALDPSEGVVYRVERQGRVDFLAKFVRPEKVDGCYLFECDESGAVRLPPVELPRSRFTWNRWPGRDDPQSPYAAWSWAYR